MYVLKWSRAYQFHTAYLSFTEATASAGRHQSLFDFSTSVLKVFHILLSSACDLNIMKATTGMDRKLQL